jgi:hypothetical protein
MLHDIWEILMVEAENIEAEETLLPGFCGRKLDEVANSARSLVSREETRQPRGNKENKSRDGCVSAFLFPHRFLPN